MSLMETSSRVERYFAETTTILNAIEISDIERMIDVLLKTKLGNGRLFFLGSGGGAGHASHATNDFRKIANFESYCVTDNVSELTARINDDGWETSYRNWLAVSKLNAQDCLFIFSVGGGSLDPLVSANLVEAMKFAGEVGASVVGVAGRDGGFLAQVADACVVFKGVPADSVTPHVEGLQAVIWHLLVTDPKLTAADGKWESLSK